MVGNDILIPLSYILLRIGYNCDDTIYFSSFDTSFFWGTQSFNREAWVSDYAVKFTKVTFLLFARYQRRSHWILYRLSTISDHIIEGQKVSEMFKRFRRSSEEGTEVQNVVYKI